MLAVPHSLKKRIMNKSFIAATILLFASLSANAQKIEAVNNVVDCGQTVYQSPTTAEFEIKNKSNHAIHIVDVRMSCGCTNVDYPKDEIPADSKFTVRVTFDGKTMGRYDKLVDIYADNSEKPLLLRMRGQVVREIVDFGGKYDFTLGSIQSDCNDIEFDDVNRGDRPQKKIHIRNTASETAQPVVMHLPDYLTAEVSPSKIAPGHSGVVTITLDSKRLKDMGLTQTSVFLGGFPGDRVSHEKEISVSAVLLPKFDNLTKTQLANAPRLYLSTKELNLGAFNGKKKLKGEVVIRNDGKKVLNIKNLQMFTVGLQVSLNKQKLQPGESAKIKVTAEERLLKTARSKPRVLMITNDPNQPKVTINIITE